MLSDAAWNLLIKYEGLDSPPDVPSDESGVTIGRGYDLGYASRDEFLRDWEGYLRDDWIRRLVVCIGWKGDQARAAARNMRDISISATIADAVLRQSVIPRWERVTRETYPGADKLPADAFGALVSLVYNRGPGFGVKGKPSWDRRREMRQLLAPIAAGEIKNIASCIRSMRRLWGAEEGNLRERREAEARLVESCLVNPIAV